jgi:hypothetical protein
MSRYLANPMLHENWHTGHGPIQLVESRLKNIFNQFDQSKLLLIYGPPNSGKRTFALSLIKRWIERQTVPSPKYVVDCMGLEGLDDRPEPEFKEENILKENKGPAHRIYCFLECQNALGSISNLFPNLSTKKKNLIVLMCCSQCPSARTFFNPNVSFSSSPRIITVRFIGVRIRI